MKVKILLFLLICTLFSCRKSQTDSSSASLIPLVRSVSIKSSVVANYWYDNQGRMICSRIVNDYGIDSTVYVFGSNSVERRLYTNGELKEVEHGILENGQVTSMIGNKTDSTSFWKSYYTYDQNGFLIREIQMDNDTVEAWRKEYQVQDNNVTSMNRMIYIPLLLQYDYYSNTINSLGTIARAGTFYGKNSSNLVKSETYIYSFGTFHQYFSYEYFDNGWVKKSTSVIGSDTVSSSYTYW